MGRKKVSCLARCPYFGDGDARKMVYILGKGEGVAYREVLLYDFVVDVL